jgi:hypothetical protein
MKASFQKAKSGFMQRPSWIYYLFFPALFCATTVWGQPVLHEPFGAVSGTPLTTLGWTQFAAVTPVINTSAGNLSYSGSIGAATGNKVLLTGAGQDVYRSFTATASPTYASFLVNVTAATATGDMFFALGASTAPTAGLYIRSSGAGFNFGVMRGAGGTLTYESTVRPLNTVLYVVMKYSVVAGVTNDSIKIFINPSPLDTEPAVADIAYSAGVGADGTVNTVQLHQGLAGNAPTVELDAITIGNPWVGVTTAQYDYGDLPSSFETNKDAVYLPALHAPAANFSLGGAPDLELSPASVAAGADNNTTNGDGNDENAISTLPTLNAGGGALTIPISVIAPVATRYIYAWLDLNGDGKFQFGEATTLAEAFAGTGATQTLNLTWSAAQMASIPPASAKMYLRIRLSATQLLDFTTAGSGGALIDERSLGNGAFSAAVAVNAPTVALGEVEDYQLNVTSNYDFGDAPVTFEQNKDGAANVAYHSRLATLMLGSTTDFETGPASVAAGADNNTTNGDGADEDALTVLPTIYRGASALTIPVAVRGPASTTSYIYAWLDLNADNKFQAGEASAINSFVGTGAAQTINLTWTAAQLATINAATTKMYFRVRVSSAALIDFTGTAGGTTIDERSVGSGTVAAADTTNAVVTNGEVEDYQFNVESGFDYGDAPVSYEMDVTTPTALSRPAVHAFNPGMKIGVLFDGEAGPASVIAGADNNTPNGDGADEDGITVLPTLNAGGGILTIPVSVTAPATTNYIYAWLDLNGDGRFQVGEESSFADAFTGTAATQTLNLTWSAAQMSTILSTTTKMYLRVRLSATALADFTTAASGGALVDERSIGNGAVSTVNAADAAAIAYGEVEDYQFNVTSNYDFGDAPVTFEQNKDGVATVAYHSRLATLMLGSTTDFETGPASVAAGADNNTTNGDGADEDALTVLPTIYRGASALTIPVTARGPVSTTSYIYAWLDLNADNKFQAGEASAISSFTGTGVAQTINLTWTAAQLATINAATTKMYFRVRVSSVALIDFTGAVGGTTIDERSVGSGAVSAADATNAVVTNGEVEDYQFNVESGFDYGDAPVSYEMDVTTPTALSRPAVHAFNPGMKIGVLFDGEAGPASVIAGADNNTPNGDGADEDGITVLPTLNAGGGILTIPVSVTAPATTNYIYAWLDLNGDGRFQVGEESSFADAFTGTAATQTLNLTWSAAQMSTILSTTTKMYLRVRLSATALADFTTAASGGALVDERSIGNGAVSTVNAADAAAIAYGEVEDYQFNVTSNYDFGDAPVTFEQNKDGVATVAYHSRLATLMLGSTTDFETGPASVAAGADNNTTNGDGADEDALTVLPTIYRGASALTIPVTARGPVSTTSYIYAWLDLNADNKFQAGEASAISSFTGTGVAQTINLTWTAAQLATINAATTKMYFRVRVSSVALIDFTGAVGGTNIDERSVGSGAVSAADATNAVVTNGEVEDYQFNVESGYDYGDAPVSYEMDVTTPTALSRPAVHAFNPAIRIGVLFDGEAGPTSVAAGADNNTPNGDGADEDGVAVLPTLNAGGSALTIPVSVIAVPAAYNYVYAWLDLNGDGRFQAGEVTTLAEAFIGTGAAQTLNLTWSTAQMGTIPSATEKMYMRVRLSTIPLVDFTTAASGGALVDERSIGNGAVSAANAANAATIAYGEVEDYQFNVISNYDFGDAPVTFEQDKDGATNPAYHSRLATLTLGNNIDGETAPASVAAGADNNTTNGDGVDEDALTILPTIYRGASGLTIPVTARGPVSTASYIYAWLDLNADNKFQAGEASAINSFVGTGAAQTVNLTWTGAQLATINAATTKMYFRVRVSSVALIDFTGAVGGTNIDERSVGRGAVSAADATNALVAGGEVEDYQFNVESGYDFGDVPASYEMDAAAVSRPAVHGYNPLFTLGGQFDGELTAASVAPGADNNTTNGDGVDEDGVQGSPKVYRGSSILRIPVIVKAPAGTQRIYAWMDLNNNGRFEAYETSAVATFTATGATQTVDLTWTVAQMDSISAGTTKLYMRVRLASAIMYDWTGGGAAGGLLDERSIQYGVTSTSAATASAVFVTDPIFGEVEDYQFAVVNGTDYGDAPLSFEKELDLTTNRPAVSGYTSGLTLGTDFDGENGPASVVAGADNNTTNGDGVDEDAIIDLPTVYAGSGGFTVPVSITAPVGTKYLYAWLDLNGNGRFEASEESGLADAFTTSGNVTLNLTWTAAQLAGINPLTTKMYLRLRLSDILLNDFTGASGGTVVDERSIGRGAVSAANAANATAITYGEVEDYQLSVSSGFDYGDVPVSYEMDNFNVARPAIHTNLSGLSIGNLFDGETAPASVTAPNSNNAPNGDGIDEDGVDLPGIDSIYRGGRNYRLNVTLNAPTGSGNKYLYGWLDINGNGRFEANELSRPAPAAITTVGSFTSVLTWDSSQLAAIPAGTTKMYLRLRYAQGSPLIDATTTPEVDERSIGNGATLASNPADNPLKLFGEVEDYQLPVVKGTDLGDLPLVFESDIDNLNRPALHGYMRDFYMGDLWDGEDASAPVLFGDDNNTTGDNAAGQADEDGLVTLPAVYRNSFSFTASVKVNNPEALTRYLYGWLDLNNDGRFQVGEAATTTFTTVGSSTQNLTWTGAQLSGISVGVSKIYLRVRLSSKPLLDFNSGTNNALIDERSIGNGANVATSGANATVIAFGEVEDYRLNVLSGLDYGDVPATFEQSVSAGIIPAVHAKMDGVSLGTLFDGENGPASVPLGSDNNFTNGDGLDEDAISALPLIFNNATFSTNIQVNNTTGTKYVYAWLDLNGDKRFQVGELAQSGPISVATAGTSTETLTWPLASINSIPDSLSNLYLRIRLSATLLTDFTGAVGGTTIDERSIGNGATSAASAVNAPTIAYGEVEDYFIAISNGNDFGDAPFAFDRNAAGDSLAARNAPSSSIRIGGIPDAETGPHSVPFTYNNNGAEGDGSDENGLLTPLPELIVGQAFTLPVRVTNTTGAAATLFGWLDLNSDGIFQVNERATTLPSVANNSSNTLVNLQWTAAQMIALSAEKIYLRLRFSTNTNTTSSGATASSPDRVAIGDGDNTETYGSQIYRGEVEDYQLKVTPAFDYGDAPYTFEYGEDNAPYPARHRTITTGATALYLGHSTDVATDYETGPHSVSNGNSANDANGDGADENGLTASVLATQAIIGSPYSVSVKVFRGTGVTGTSVVHGWLDFNGDGRFTVNEKNVNAATVTGTGDQLVTLTWNGISASSVNMYLRLRVTSAAFADGAGQQVDSRSTGHGNSVGDYAGLAPDGEIEDYSIPTDYTPLPFNVDCDFLYGKVQSTFHSTIALGPDGIFKAWGNGMGYGSAYGADILSPTTIDKLMYPALTGSVLKATFASNSTNNTNQVIVLSTAGLFAGGVEGQVVPDALTTSITFQKIIAPANADPTTGLPIGIMPGDVRHMMATPGAVILLANGRIYVLGSAATLYGDRLSNTAADVLWHSVTNYDGSVLTGINHVVMSNNTGFAVDGADNFYTWGSQQYLGDGTSVNAASGSLPANSGTGGATNFWRARPMTKPSPWAGTKMIATTGLAGSYFVLGTDGYVYSMGNGTSGVLGIGSTANNPVWQRVKTNAGTDLANVRMIAANDQDAVGYAAMGATGSAGECYTWGSAAGNMTGHAADRNYATVPSGFVLGTDRANFIEVGGHTTVIVKDGSSKYCYVGHRVNGSMGDGSTGNVFEPAFVCDRTGDAKVACSQLLDAGDAPAKFENGMGDNRAVHSIFYNNTPQQIYLGSNPGDDEYGTIYNVGDGADNEGANGDGADEDGIVKASYDGNGVYTLTVNGLNNTGTTANIYGWIDWNNNGIFEASEIAVNTMPSSASPQTRTLTWSKAGKLICNTESAMVRSYSRVRFTTQTLTDKNTTVYDERSLAAAKDGEIEDGFLDWETSQKRDYGNIANTASIFWPISYATVLTTGDRAWLGINSDDPTTECETDADDANTSGLNITGTDITGNGTHTTPYVMSVGSAYTFNLTVNNNAAAATDVHWGVWFDTDGNGKFNESADIFQGGATPVAGSATNTNFTITLPPSLLGNTTAKVRVVATYTNTTFTKAQNGEIQTVNGEVEDYYINLKDVNAIFVSGLVWDDGDGSVTKNGAEVFTNAGGALYVNLVDASGNIENSVAVASDGTYSMPVKMSTNGYKLVLSTSSTDTIPSVPAAWVNTGDQVGTDNGTIQSAVLGVINLNTNISNIGNQNFGIEQIPTADPKTGTDVANPGAAAVVPVPAFSGSDPEDLLYLATDVNRTYIINTLPDTATGVLYYNGVAVTAGQVIPNFNNVLLTFDPVDGTVPVAFTYSVVDAAGKPSLPAPVTFSVSAYDFGDLTATVWPVARAKQPTYKMTTHVPNVWDDVSHQQVVVWAGNALNLEPTTANGGNALASTDQYDDGLSSPSTAITPGTATTYTVTLNANKSGVMVYYRLWFDWNADGNFSNDNDYGGNAATYAGSAVTAGAVNVPVDIVPPVGASRNYVVRLVVTDSTETDAGLIPDYYRTVGSNYVIALRNGEVEDYSTPVPLPVKFVRMNAVPLDCKIKVSFETVQETDVDHFEIMHSTDGVKWIVIAKEQPMDLPTGRKYVVIHEYPVKGNNYYRIKEVGINGEASYSSVANVHHDCNDLGRIRVYPNPASNVVYLEGTEAGQVYRVMDITGKQLLSGITSAKLTVIALTALPAGTYHIELANGADFKVQKQ